MRNFHVLFAMAWLLSACSPAPTAPILTENIQTQQPPQIDPREQQKSRTEKFVATNAQNFANFAMKLVKSDRLPNTILNQLTAAANNDKKNKPETLYEPKALLDFYEARQFEPLFVSGLQLDPRSAPLIAELEHPEQHGLTNIHTATWLKLRDELASDASTNTDEFAFTPQEQAQIVDLLIERNIALDDATAVRALLIDLAQSPKLMPRLHQIVTEKTQKLAQTEQRIAKLELHTASLSLQFAREMAFNNRTHLTDDETASLGRRPTEAKYNAIAQNRTNA